jgi:succinate dehydrogenase / fumarate reductase cytochrome b subunit
MSASPNSVRIPSLLKKYLMAITGAILALFVLGHMLGNLQFFMGPDVINAYALHLHSLPFHPFSLYAIRSFLLLCVVVHVVMAILLVKENRAARPAGYDAEKPKAATLSSKLMPLTGLVLLVYIVFHLMHFTIRVGPGEYAQSIHEVSVNLGHGKTAVFHDVYGMMVIGFQHWGTSLFYVVATGLLCVHLTHGFSSMFQSLGLRNEKWRPRLDAMALAYGWVVFLGFAIIPISVALFGVGDDYVQHMKLHEAGAYHLDDHDHPHLGDHDHPHSH